VLVFRAAEGGAVGVCAEVRARIGSTRIASKVNANNKASVFDRIESSVFSGNHHVTDVELVNGQSG
jgi:hypothetical protein